jgi:hypothetical protein
MSQRFISSKESTRFLLLKAMKFLNDIEKHLPILVENFKEQFPEVKTGNVLEKEILKRVAFFTKIFTP